MKLAIVSASNLAAADKCGTSDPFAVAEVVESATGKSLKRSRTTKTKTIKKTLNPVWNADEVSWPDIEEDVSTLSLKITVFDSDTFGKEILGIVVIPLYPGMVSEDNHPLEKGGKLMVSGSIKVRIQVRGSGESGKKADDMKIGVVNAKLDTNPQTQDVPRDQIKACARISAAEAVLMPNNDNNALIHDEQKIERPSRNKIWRKEKRVKMLHVPTWRERLSSCVEQFAGERLDFSRLKLGDSSFGPGTDTSLQFTKMGLKNTLLHLNLKGNDLTEFPKSFCIGFPHLETLILSFNSLTDLPDEVSHLESLSILAIDHNLFKELPLCIFSTTLKHSLVSINCAGNKLTALPEGERYFSDMFMLKSVLLANNKLTTLPRELEILAEVHAFVEIDLTNNPLIQDDSDYLMPKSLQRILNKQASYRTKSKRQSLMQRGVSIKARMKEKLERIDSMV